MEENIELLNMLNDSEYCCLKRSCSGNLMEMWPPEARKNDRLLVCGHIVPVHLYAKQTLYNVEICLM